MIGPFSQLIARGICLLIIDVGYSIRSEPTLSTADVG
jgi:hypothetical protein